MLAVRVDASYGSGHWYEGGGIYRDTFIVATRDVHIVDHGLRLVPAADATLAPMLEVANAGDADVRVVAAFRVLDANGTQVAAADSARTRSLLGQPPQCSRRWPASSCPRRGGGRCKIRIAIR